MFIFKIGVILFFAGKFLLSESEKIQKKESNVDFQYDLERFCL